MRYQSYYLYKAVIRLLPNYISSVLDHTFRQRNDVTGYPWRHVHVMTLLVTNFTAYTFCCRQYCWTGFPHSWKRKSKYELNLYHLLLVYFLYTSIDLFLLKCYINRCIDGTRRFACVLDRLRMNWYRHTMPPIYTIYLIIVLGSIRICCQFLSDYACIFFIILLLFIELFIVWTEITIREL